jgi:hypothetical protein
MEFSEFISDMIPHCVLDVAPNPELPLELFEVVEGSGLLMIILT